MSRPLSSPLRLDPGWPFLLAGLAVCCASILVPAHEDLATLREQTGRLHAQEGASLARLNAQVEFIEQLEANDPALVRRLAASQLNLVPADQTPVLLASSRTAGVSEWIDATLPAPEHGPKERSRTLLSRLTNGTHRLWIMAAGVMAVFVGLLFEAGPQTRRGH